MSMETPSELRSDVKLAIVETGLLGPIGAFSTVADVASIAGWWGYLLVKFAKHYGSTLDKEAALAEAPFDAIFIGDDWKGSPRWTETEKVLAQHGVDVVYLSYTKDISSTILREQEGKAIRE